MHTRFFDCAEQDGYLKMLIQWLWENMSVGRGLAALQFFGNLKWTLELLISVKMSPHMTF